MHSSRGCPFGCDFCLWNQVMYGNGKYRMFSVKRVVDEMVEAAEKYGAREVYFDDDSFTINKEHVLGICGEIMGRGLSLKWSCMGDAMVTDKETIDAMADAGCIGMKFGVESADETILKGIGKPVDIERVKDVASWASDAGLKTHATFTFGLYGDTKEMMEKTLNYALRLDVDSVQFSMTTPFPGTRFYEKLKREGMLMTECWRDYDGASNSVIKYPVMSHSDVEAFCKKAKPTWFRHKLMSPGWMLRQTRNLYRLAKGQGLGAATRAVGSIVRKYVL